MRRVKQWKILSWIVVLSRRNVQPAAYILEPLQEGKKVIPLLCHEECLIRKQISLEVHYLYLYVGKRHQSSDPDVNPTNYNVYGQEHMPITNCSLIELGANSAGGNLNLVI